MLMYLMDDRKLLKLSLRRLEFPEFLRFLFLSLFHTYLKLKSIYCLTSFFPKRNANLTGRKRQRLWRKKGNYFLYVISWTNIIHWIDLNLGHYSCNIVHIYQKNKENCHQTGNELTEISCLVRSVCVYFGS